MPCVPLPDKNANPADLEGENMNSHAFRSKPKRFRTFARALLVVMLAVPALAISLHPNRVFAADFSVGDTVVVDTDRLNLRADAGTSSAVVEVLDNGVTGVVTDGPVDAD